MQNWDQDGKYDDAHICTVEQKSKAVMIPQTFNIYKSTKLTGYRFLDRLNLHEQPSCIHKRIWNNNIKSSRGLTCGVAEDICFKKSFFIDSDLQRRHGRIFDAVMLQFWMEIGRACAEFTGLPTATCSPARKHRSHSGFPARCRKDVPVHAATWKVEPTTATTATTATAITRTRTHKIAKAQP